MSSVVNIVLPIFGLILAGFIGRRSGVLGDAAATELNRFVVWFCLPSLLFTATATASWSALWQPDFIAVNVIATLGVFCLTLAWRQLAGQRFVDASIDGLSAAYANVGYIGIPLCALVLGDPGMVPALIATLVVVCVLFAIAVVCVEVGLQADKRIGPATLKVLIALTRNPLVVAPVVGGCWAASGLSVPQAPAKFLDLLGAATTPCALVSIGASSTTWRIRARCLRLTTGRQCVPRRSRRWFRPCIDDLQGTPCQAGRQGCLRLDVRKMPLGTTPRAETACSASHARPTWPDEPSKLDRQQGFGYSSILDRGRLFFLYSNQTDDALTRLSARTEQAASQPKSARTRNGSAAVIGMADEQAVRAEQLFGHDYAHQRVG